jgi:HSP20 family molecular chaperone IbpA
VEGGRIIRVENRLLTLNVRAHVTDRFELSDNDKRVPIRVPGPDERDPPPSSTQSHINDLDQKFKDLSRLFKTPVQLAEDRFPSKGTPRNLSRVRHDYVDLFDQGSDYRVLVELPAARKDELWITLTSRSIKVDLALHPMTIDEGQRQEYQGRVSSTVLRPTPLPEEVVPEKAEAFLNNGILEVRMPKRVPTRASKHRILVR